LLRRHNLEAGGKRLLLFFADVRGRLVIGQPPIRENQERKKDLKL
jgi:hypothetical protein